MVKESVALSYQEGASDKVYNAELVEQSTGFVVNFAYGRRGNSLVTGTKTNFTVTYEVAKKTFDKLVKSKTAKGYKEKGANLNTINIVTDKEDSGIRPQLLNDISEIEANFYIEDDAYCMQEKFDGRRKMITCDESNYVQGVNKKGVIIAINEEIKKLCEKIPGPYIIDGEDMGDYMMLFDDITEPHLPYLERYQILRELVHPYSDTLKFVKTAWSTNTKQIMFDRLKRERAEGVVFKLADAPYTAGRPASGGDQLKCKFYDTASCVVESVSSVKNSIGLQVYDELGESVSIGNATVYANSPKLYVGDIVEVKYLYYNEGGSLYQPVLLSVRDDVDMSECTLVKLKRKKDD